MYVYIYAIYMHMCTLRIFNASMYMSRVYVHLECRIVISCMCQFSIYN